LVTLFSVVFVDSVAVDFSELLAQAVRKSTVRPNKIALLKIGFINKYLIEAQKNQTNEFCLSPYQ
jgi:hypothetical protein